MTQLARTTHSLTPSAKLGSLATFAKSPFLLLDASGSMSERLRSNTELRRIDRLREIVASLNQKGVAFRQLVFDSFTVESFTIHEPRGGTALHLAIADALEKGATKIVVVSDGQPDNADAALGQAVIARDRGVKIDVMFCGDEGDPGAEFLRRLAETTGGHGENVNLDDEPEALTGKTMLMLGDGSDASKAIAL